MRRVICDILIVITTISQPDADPSGRETLCLPADPQARPELGFPTDQPHEKTDDPVTRWLIYQEFIFVHCQRDPTAADNVIDSQ